MLTDVAGVYDNWGKPDQALIRNATPQTMERKSFPAGSMGPKVKAACEFVRATGGFAAIGQLAECTALIEGTTGTRIRDT